MPKTVAGIDYSLVSPAICCYSTASGYFMFESCDFYVLSNKKKIIGIVCRWKTSGQYTCRQISRLLDRYRKIW